MKKIVFSLILIFVVSTLILKIYFPEDDTEAEMLPNKNVEIPSAIFTSEKNNRVIDEKEMKLSITTYLDSNKALEDASIPMEKRIDYDQKLTKKELKKYNKIKKLVIENDKNFAHYIMNNTLPEDYQDASKRISNYITGINQVNYELVDNLDEAIDGASEGNFSKMFKTIEKATDNSKAVNGREEKKIEKFLDEKNIPTKEFGRD